MNDREFKSLAHYGQNKGWRKVSGKELSVGYKPDVVLRDENNAVRVILECENKTDRKAFIGALVKAEHFAQQQQRTVRQDGSDSHPSLELIIVMREFPNTQIESIHKQLSLYASWLRDLRGCNLSLSSIRLMTDESYLLANKSKIKIGSKSFSKLSRLVWPS